MGTFLYYVDIHHGEKMLPYNATSILLHGQYSMAIHKAIHAYAQQNNITAMIHGGDESYYNPNSTSFFKRANEMAREMQKGSIPTHRIIGNHEPINQLNNLGFLTSSFTRAHNNTQLVCLQPNITTPAHIVKYTYDPTETKNLLTQVPVGDNAIVASHWSFGRVSRGYNVISGGDKGYHYIDTLDPLSGQLAGLANGNPSRVLNLSGHEHRFSLRSDLGFQCLVMPSVVQNDIDDIEKPCGLFVEITDETPDGSLSMTFKKIVLNTDEPEKSKIKTVSHDYMKRYYRAISPQVSVP